MSKRFLGFALLMYLGVALPPPAVGELVTLTLDELPFQPADEVQILGVTFDFKMAGVDSNEANYHDSGPGILDTVDDPSLLGPSTGILTIDFDSPTDILNFGVALNTADSLSPGYTVELFDEALESLEVLAVDTVTSTGTLGFSEAPFEYSGTPVARAVIDFADAPGSFAFDNLTYFIPEPSAASLAILALALLSLRKLLSINI